MTATTPKSVKLNPITADGQPVMPGDYLTDGNRLVQVLKVLNYEAALIIENAKADLDKPDLGALTFGEVLTRWRFVASEDRSELEKHV